MSNRIFIMILSVLLVSLAGCGEYKLIEISCDSGFSTGVSYDAYFDDGVTR